MQFLIIFPSQNILCIHVNNIPPMYQKHQLSSNILLENIYVKCYLVTKHKYFLSFNIGPFSLYFNESLFILESAFRNMRGSNAVNALNRFSQSENPRMNAELEDRAERAALATMRIVMKYYILFSYISVLMYVIFALSVTYFFYVTCLGLVMTVIEFYSILS